MKRIAIATLLAACAGPAPARFVSAPTLPRRPVETYICQSGSTAARITIAGELLDVELTLGADVPTRCTIAALGPDQGPKK